MTPEAWAFFSAQSLALIALLGRSVEMKRNEIKVKDKLDETDVKHERNYQEIIENTKPVSNGTIPKMADDIAFIRDVVGSLDKRVGRLEEKVK